MEKINKNKKQDIDHKIRKKIDITNPDSINDFLESDEIPL